MKTALELKQNILEKADEDQAFRARLLNEPKSALKDEFDISLPAEFDLLVHEDSTTRAHLVLAPNPRLTQDQLAAVAGGIHGGVGHPLW